MNRFTKISDILNNEAINPKTQLFSIKKGVVFGFWKNVAGATLAKFSSPYDIKGSTLFVTVRNPQVMQELILFKSTLLTKIKTYCEPLNITINEIRYDYKNWNKIKTPVILEGDETGRELENEEIEEVTLTNFEKEEMKKVTNTITSMDFLSSELKTKYLKTIENSIKAKKLQKK